MKIILKREVSWFLYTSVNYDIIKIPWKDVKKEDHTKYIKAVFSGVLVNRNKRTK